MASEQLTILFLAADPVNKPKLQLDEEQRAIDRELRLAKHRDRFDLRVELAVRYSDLQELLLRYEPVIVHFSGHGSEAGEILLKNASGSARPVQPVALARLFARLKGSVRCVVLNACYSERQAAAIAQSVDCVVGMARALSDEAARDFAEGFYLGLGYGRSVGDAFGFGLDRIELSDLGEESIPKLAATRVDPYTLYLVGERASVAPQPRKQAEEARPPVDEAAGSAADLKPKAQGAQQSRPPQVVDPDGASRPAEAPRAAAAPAKNRVQEEVQAHPEQDVMRQELLQRMRSTDAPAAVRVLTGKQLAKLGDPRAEVRDPLRMEFCLVPSGRFVMGAGREQHEYHVPYDYWIGRYPVTVAQFAAFTDASGYREGKYWLEARREGLWKSGRYVDRNQPYRYGEPFDFANHPVIGVSWYEALAFVRWLDEVSTGKPQGMRLSLASEPEWEKAARGGMEVVEKPLIVPLDQVGGASPQGRWCSNELAWRRYPWGSEPDAERANYDGTVGSTSAVGCFAHGVSPYGAEEMSGNAWEWTRSLNAAYPYPSGGTELGKREQLPAGRSTERVLRGGAFDCGPYRSSCAARKGSVPDLDDGDYGFRLVLGRAD
jgi:formylglycine-generating enzyme required for sulfatase activity